MKEFIKNQDVIEYLGLIRVNQKESDFIRECTTFVNKYIDQDVEYILKNIDLIKKDYSKSNIFEYFTSVNIMDIKDINKVEEILRENYNIPRREKYTIGNRNYSTGYSVVLKKYGVCLISDIDCINIELKSEDKKFILKIDEFEEFIYSEEDFKEEIKNYKVMDDEDFLGINKYNYLLWDRSSSILKDNFIRELLDEHLKEWNVRRRKIAKELTKEDKDNIIAKYYAKYKDSIQEISVCELSERLKSNSGIGGSTVCFKGYIVGFMNYSSKGIELTLNYDHKNKYNLAWKGVAEILFKKYKKNRMMQIIMQEGSKPINLTVELESSHRKVAGQLGFNF